MSEGRDLWCAKQVQIGLVPPGGGAEEATNNWHSGQG
jgi:hypothetical protein